MDAPTTSDTASDQVSQRRGWLLILGSLAMVTATLAGSFLWTDDAFPMAPFRMFSYGNSPNSVVRTMRFEADLENGEHVRLDASTVGLRRAELEEQTNPHRRVPDENLEAIAAVYNERHDPDMVHLQVVVRRIDMVDGVPQPGETITVIGDWADDRYTGERVDVDLDLAEPWGGYGS